MKTPLLVHTLRRLKGWISWQFREWHFFLWTYFHIRRLIVGKAYYHARCTNHRFRWHKVSMPMSGPMVVLCPAMPYRYEVARFGEPVTILGDSKALDATDGVFVFPAYRTRSGENVYQ